MSAEVKPGFKRTEAGVIPKGWDVTTIGQVVNDFRGGAPLKPSEFTFSGVRVLPKGGVGYGGLLEVAENEWQFCSQHYADKHANNQVDSSYTIVVLRDLVPSGPSIGLAVRITDSISYVLAQGVYGFKVAPHKLEQCYIIQLSNTSPYRKLMNSIMVGSTQVHITNTAYKLAPIPLPPLPEQRAIAVALSDMDALISSLDQLITKKRDIQQAAMQQLLTGQRRLPGFNGEWEVKPFSCVLKRINAKAHQIQTSDYQATGKYPVVDQGKDSIIGFSDNEEKRFRNTDDGVIVFGDHTCIVKFVDFDFLVGADGTQVLHGVEGQSTRFHAFQLQYRGIEPTGYNRHFKFLKERSFQAPPLDEQTAIATILSDMDTELAALEARRHKARQLKQGMMQELLTGRIRLLEHT